MTADELLRRGQEVGLRLQRQAAERREHRAGASEPAHVRKRLPKGTEVKTYTVRLTVDAYLYLTNLCLESHREMNIILDELVRERAGIGPLLTHRCADPRTTPVVSPVARQ